MAAREQAAQLARATDDNAAQATDAYDDAVQAADAYDDAAQATDARHDEGAARLAQAAGDWLACGLTTASADRPAAEAAVRQAYRAAGLAPPRHLIWLGSPRAGTLAATLLTGAGPDHHASDAVGPGGFGAAGSDGPAPSDRRAEAPAADRDNGLGGDLATIASALREQGCPPSPGAAGRSVRSQVRTVPWAAARAAAVERLGAAGWAAHWAAGGQRTWHLLSERLVTPLRTSLSNQLTEGIDDGFAQRVRTALLDVVLGQHDAAWLSAYDGNPELVGLAGVAGAAGWWWPYEQVAILTERPTRIERDNLGRLHHGDGPALAYPDGFGLHFWRGMPIPAEIAAELPRLTADRIRAERNAEMRRVMLEHFGYERYLRDSGAKAVHRDKYGVLWRINLPEDEPLVMVEVVNATPEPDGTSRTYWLRVPPDTRTARAGVAWTFGMEPEQYAPLVQT